MDDIQTLPSLNVLQLEIAARRSDLLRDAVTTEMRARFIRILMRFFENPTRFIEVLDQHASIVSGSAALNFLEGNSGWQANDLDVYTPLDQFDAVRQYLLHAEGFQETWVEARMEQPRVAGGGSHFVGGLTRVRYDRFLMETGIVRVASLRKGDWKVDVIQSRSQSALYAISRFWSTLQMNFISARGYCCAYPDLTFQGVGVLNPLLQNRDMVPYPFLRPLITKYEGRGYHLYNRWYEANDGVGCGVQHTNICCPGVARAFEDGYSYSGTFGGQGVPAEFDTPRGAFVSVWKVGWQLGGYHRAGEPHSHVGHRTRSWHGVTGQADRVAVVVRRRRRVPV